MRTDLLRVLKSNGMGLVLVAALALFPFALSLLSGGPVNAGAPKFWQGMLAQVFILAVYALSYDLLLGITGVLSFGHAMFIAPPAGVRWCRHASRGCGIWLRGRRTGLAAAAKQGKAKD